MVRPLLDHNSLSNGDFSPGEQAALACIVARACLFDEGDVAGALRLLEPLYQRAEPPSAESQRARAEVETWLGWSDLLSVSSLESRRALLRLNLAAQRTSTSAPPEMWLWIHTGRALALEALGYAEAASLPAGRARGLGQALQLTSAERWLERLAHVPSRAVLEYTSMATSMGEVVREVRTAASCRIPMLIAGESGTGRRHLARTVQKARGEADIRICRCNGESGEVIAHELDEVLSSPDPIMLVFHEVDRLPSPLQRELAARLERMPAASSAPIFTSTSSLTRLADEERVVPELLAWCGTWPVSLPPLRERTEDIPLLTHALLRSLRWREMPPVAITDDAMRLLCAYAWPGNIRQLSNELERALTLVRSEPAPVIDVHRISNEIVHASALATSVSEPHSYLDEILAEKEKAIIENVLAQNGGQVSASADRLGLTRQGLYKKMKRLGVDPARYQTSESNGSLSPANASVGDHAWH